MRGPHAHCELVSLVLVHVASPPIDLRAENPDIRECPCILVHACQLPGDSPVSELLLLELASELGLQIVHL